MVNTGLFMDTRTYVQTHASAPLMQDAQTLILAQLAPGESWCHRLGFGTTFMVKTMMDNVPPTDVLKCGACMPVGVRTVERSIRKPPLAVHKHAPSSFEK
eukprot:1151555-Pelagomonas_calceolata.AAC.1